MFVGKHFHIYGPLPSCASVSPLLWNGISRSRLFCDFADTDKMLMLLREVLMELWYWWSFLLVYLDCGEKSPYCSPLVFFRSQSRPLSWTAFPWGTTVVCFFPGRPCRKEGLWFNSRAKHSKPQKHPGIKCLPPPGFPSNLESLSTLFLKHNGAWKEPVWVLYSTGHIFKSSFLPFVPLFKVFLSLIYGFGDHL